ncbi:MAG: DNA-binding protein [Clostridia bacterium]|nr:DNA-binding protein [Clostridia bacterium]
MHGKSRPMVKKLCQNDRIKGAIKHSTGWLIPKNAPYPKRKTRECKPKNI